MSYQQINTSLYELHSPATGEPPTMEILLFHGLQQPGQDPKDAFWKTWTCGDECWPKTWLAEEGNFPNARILAVSYDASVRSSATEGRLELCTIGENLVQDIICSNFAPVGRTARCPVFLIGHCLGGLVLKQLIVVAQTRVLLSPPDPSVKSFLGNIGGIFYFSTPNSGEDIANFTTYFSQPSPVVSILSVLNAQAARLNNEFRKWRRDNKVKAYAVAESELTRVGRSDVLVVSEASARYDVDMFTLAPRTDHFNICAPQRPRYSSSLHILRDFIRKATDEKIRGHVTLGPLMSDLNLHPKPVRLPFVSDERFVHLESSFSRIKAALESKQEHVVTLYGGPGLGKSCMAKYVALYYQQSQAHFLDGVCYMSCGPGAQLLAKYEELFKTLTGESPQAFSEFALKQQLLNRLRNKSLLIVLDNVCQTELLGKLLVPGQDVKYLITSQIRGIWQDSKQIRMETPTLEEASKILVHALPVPEFSEHLQGHGLPKAESFGDLQEVVEAIIREWNFNPSILASLVMVIDYRKALVGKEWKMASKYLMELVLKDSSSSSVDPVLYGTIYCRDSSMMSSLNSLPPPAQCLIYLMAICDSPGVPEVVLHILFTKVESQATRFRSWKRVLEDHSFIRLQSSTVPWSPENRCIWIIDKFPKHALKEKKKLEVGKCMDVLFDETDKAGTVPLVDNELLAALCLEYGDEGLRERAGHEMGLSTATIGSTKSSFRPYIWTLLAEIEKRESHARVLASEIFIRHMRDDETSNEGVLPTLPGALEGCVKVMMEMEMDMRTHLLEKAASCLRDPAGKAVTNKIKKNSMMVTLEALVKQLTDMNRNLQERAALCLAFLAQHGDENSIMIASVGGALEALLNMLGKHGSPSRQQSAIMCLSILASNAQIRARIASIPGALDASVTLLHNGKAWHPIIQEYAVRCLGNLAIDTQISLSIGSIPYVLESLVNLLGTDGRLSLLERTTFCLNNLSTDERLALKIASIPGALETLVKLLGMDESPLLQERTISILGHLASSPENNAKIGSIEGALKAVVELLGKAGNLTLLEEVTWCLSSLIRNTENQAKVASIKGVMETLVKLLGEDGSLLLQKRATNCLVALASDAENKKKITSIEGSVEALEKLRSGDRPLELRRTAAFCIHKLTGDIYLELLEWTLEEFK